jgi:hypothetical protein
MKYLKSINEGKHIGDLYHVLDYEKLKFVLQSNTIRSYKGGGGRISTSRDKMFNSYLGDTPTSIFKLVLDGEKLSNHYKINPFRYFSRNGEGFDEREEQIKTPIIQNARKYIKHVVLIKSRVESLMVYPWSGGKVSNYLTTLGTRNGTLPDIIKDVKTRLEKEGIDLLVQDGSKIESNDKFVNFLINHPIKKIETKKVVMYRGRIPGGRKYSYHDSIIDLSGKIIYKDIVIGNVEVSLKNIVFLEIDGNNIERLKKDIKAKKFDGYIEKFDPYVFDFTLEDNGKWKLKNMRPLKWF